MEAYRLGKSYIGRVSFFISTSGIGRLTLYFSITTNSKIDHLEAEFFKKCVWCHAVNSVIEGHKKGKVPESGVNKEL